MAQSNPSFEANGNILPSHFVTMVGEHLIEQVSATTQIVHGIMQEGQRRSQGAELNPSGWAAIAGDKNFEVYGPGEQCLLMVDGSVSAGQWVAGTATGGGANWSSSGGLQHIGARALNHGADDELVRVQVVLFAFDGGG